MEEHNFKIGIVVPCYNEANRIQLHEFEKYVQENTNCTFCFVNDGSNDNTLQILENAVKKNNIQLRVLNNPQNKGKAEAVRQGINHLYATHEFDIIGFLDADLATPLKEINHIVLPFNDDEKLIVFGARIMHMGGAIQRKFIRFVLGRIFATIVSFWILKTPVYDTQCGFKFFRNKIVPIIFANSFHSRWFFDIELFCRAIQQYSLLNINIIAQEYFLHQWNDVKGSKIKCIDYIKVPFELIKLKLNYKI